MEIISVYRKLSDAIIFMSFALDVSGSESPSKHWLENGQTPDILADFSCFSQSTQAKKPYPLI